MRLRSLLVAVPFALAAVSAHAQGHKAHPPVDARGVEKLRAEANADVTLDPGSGAARFVRGKGRGLLKQAAARSAAQKQEHSKAFFRQYGSVFGIAEPDASLVPQASVADAHGWTHHTFKQVYRGVPVFGGELKTHFNPAGELESVSGTSVPNIAVNPTPTVGADAAAGAALARVTEAGGEGVAVRSTTLYIFRTGLAQGVEGENHLAWEVEVGNGTDVRELVYVDAHSAKVLDQITGIQDGLRRRAYDGAFLPNVPPSYPNAPFWVEGDAFPTASTEANNMIIASQETYNFFNNAFGRDSIDGAGATMDSIFNRGYDCPNASWNGVFISFCNGFTTDDVTAHEWGHAYTQYTHNLIYQWQSGALNESYSDIWGEVVDQINGRGVDLPGGARTAGTCSAFSPEGAALVINSPAAIAGTFPAQAALFGPPVPAAGITAAAVVAADDSNAAGPLTTDACTPLTNAAAVAGKIALADRGTCNFSVKVFNAQQAGAIAVLIGNNAATGLPGMGAGISAELVTIPSIGITQGDATAIKANAAAGVNVTIANTAGVTDNSYRWLMGEEVTPGGALRDMWNPSCYSNPGKVSEPAYYTCSTADNGGVHTNSGVPNHAFALLTDGGTYNGHTVGQIGMVKAAHIYFRAQSVYQGPASNFVDHADALEQSCSDLVGQPLTALTGGPSGEVITTSDCAQVAEAISAVELRTPPAFCNFQPLLAQNAPDRCEPNTTQVDIFAESFETDPSSRWTASHTAASATFTNRDWMWANVLPQRDGSGIFGADPIIGACTPADDQSGVLHIDSPEIALASGVTAPRLTFDHWVATEAGWDGGQLQISVDGGAWRQVERADFTFNRYNARLQTVAAGNTNPQAGQFAFTGSDGGSVGGTWGRSHVNLAPYAAANQSFRLRFDVGTDGCNGVIGWYVDDVNVFACTSTTAPTASINDVAVVEGNAGTSHAVFTVTLDHAYAQPVSVTYRIVDGTAKRGRDYIPADELEERTLVIPALSISGEIPIRIRGDVDAEANETFTVEIRRITNGTVGDGTGTATILNDDGALTTRR